MKIPTQIFLPSVLALLLVNQSCRKPIREKDSEGLRLNASTSASCEGPQRYRNIIFDNEDISVVNNIIYRQINQFHENDSHKDSLKLDLYEPNRSWDTETNRPLIIYMHGGGGFINSKEGEVTNCMNFAKRGYVVAAINYRLIKDRLPDTTGRNPDSLLLLKKIITRGYYRAIQDARFAVRFAKANASAVNVDTNKIFFSGLSNGGVQTLHVAYFDDEEARVLDDEELVDIDVLGPLDFVNANVPFSATGKITAGICYSGWIFDISWIEAGDPPMVLIHAQSDNYAPITAGLDWFFRIFQVWGPQAIQPRLQQLGIPEFYYEYPDGPPGCLAYQCGGDHGDVVADNIGSGPNLREYGVQLAFNAIFDYYFCD